MGGPGRIRPTSTRHFFLFSVLHLFYVYSGIVARLVPHIIGHLQLDPADILIVTDRSQTRASVDHNLRSERPCFEPFFNRWKTLPHDWRSLLHNSRQIDRLTEGREFIAYLPSPSDPLCQQILHHPRCTRYWLIEEGLGSYCKPGASPVHVVPLTRFQQIQIGTRIRGLGRIAPAITDYPHWPAKYAGCFGSNAQTFPEFPAPVVNLNAPLYQAVPSSITRLVIFDDFSAFNKDQQGAFLEVIRQVLASENSPGDHWAYKLHPRCAAWPWLNQEVATVFRENLAPGTPCEPLPPDTCAEDIGLAAGVTTYGYMSSCLFYIDQGGGKVASFKQVAERMNPGFQSLWQRFFPPVLEELVDRYRMLEIPLPR